MEPPIPRKPGRPRDELGRPLAWDAANRLHLEDFDRLTAEEDHQLGVRHFQAGRYFPAHEAWETAWKLSRGQADEEFFKGLAQLGAGYVHLLRGNAHGARVLLGRAAARLDAYPSPHRGVDVALVVSRCGADREAIEAGALVPGPLALDVHRPTVA